MQDMASNVIENQKVTLMVKNTIFFKYLLFFKSDIIKTLYKCYHHKAANF